jgi:hypothetical protein
VFSLEGIRTQTSQKIYIKESSKKRTKRIFHGDLLRRRKETLLINILKPSLNDK